jgi:hypothetical protein
MKLNSVSKIVLAAVVLWCVSGCASIMSGRFQEVSFQSSPDGATVTISGKIIGKTPLTTSLKKESGQSLLFEKDGYKPLSMELSTRLDNWFWGNILLGGVIGSTTDGMTGAVDEYSPNQYMVTLNPQGTTKLEEMPARSDTQKTKEYIVMAYKDILSDLRKGEGQYLSSLLALLHVKPEEKGDAVKKIRALSEAYTVIPDFADHVIDLYQERPANVAPKVEPPAKRKPNGPIDAFFQDLNIGEKVVVKLNDGKVVRGTYEGSAQEGVSVILSIRNGLFLFKKTFEFKDIQDVRSDMPQSENSGKTPDPNGAN